MGVMSCSRSYCESIMCDTYIDGVGYVCGDCEREFTEYLRKGGKNPKTVNEIKNELNIFIDTDKNSYNSDEMSIGDFFNQYRKDYGEY